LAFLVTPRLPRSADHNQGPTARSCVHPRPRVGQQLQVPAFFVRPLPCAPSELFSRGLDAPMSYVSILNARDQATWRHPPSRWGLVGLFFSLRSVPLAPPKCIPTPQSKISLEKRKDLLPPYVYDVLAPAVPPPQSDMYPFGPQALEFVPRYPPNLRLGFFQMLNSNRHPFLTSTILLCR